MYRVRFIIQRPGYRKRYLSGFYIPRQEGMPVSEMKRECTEFIRSRLQKEDARFLDFTMELTVFRRVNVDFIYQAESSPGLR
ncbi:hypothetical protein B5G09_10180 [Alistipes sp. An54]|nr:hypothetical protein B5G09_10180 [Alistipes sp. An54]